VQRKNLTEAAVAKLVPPAAGQMDYHDAIVPGLILRVSYGGAKTWLARHYLHRANAAGVRISVPTTHKLGRYPILKLKDARERARSFLMDPTAARTADAGSFRDVAETFLRRHVHEQGLRTEREIRRILTTVIYPHWAERPFRDIRRGDVAVLLDHVQDHRGARQADKALSIVRSLMNWFATRNGDYASVIVKGMNRYDKGRRARARVLTDAELVALWGATDKSLGTLGSIVRMLLLTGQRKEKVATMRWSDIRGDVWVIQSAPREKSNAGTLRLPPAALDIIAVQPRIAGNPYVFAGSTGGPFSSFGEKKRTLDRRLGGTVTAHWVLHDLRRTAKTLMARAGVRRDISERVLGHVITGIEGVYDRHNYAAEKAEALAALAALLERIISPPADNVEELGARRQARR
jgi:integrase